MAWYRTGGGGGSSSNPHIIEVQIQNAQIVYSDQLTYEVGDYVFYNDTLYVCVLAVTTPEPFDSEKWDEVE